MSNSLIIRVLQLLGLAAGILSTAGTVYAEEEIVIGGSIPITGVFSFAGVNIHAGIGDYVKLVNDQGGVMGRKVRYVYEDTGYKADASVAAFKKLTSQNPVHLYYGDSTAFSKIINPELNRTESILMTGASFATEINDPRKYPYQFMVGPDYQAMFALLLKYIAREKPNATVAFVYSDSEFGRDPIEENKKTVANLGLKLVAEVITPPGSVDVSTEVLKLRRADPDYTIFHGYVLAPIPEFISLARKMGMQSQFMGTFWSMDKNNIMKMGEDADGFLGIMPYRYSDDASADAPMLEKIRQIRPGYQSTTYLQGFVAAMLLLECAKRTLEADQELNAKNLTAAFIVSLINIQT
jgi:branched-chain amino acid transport system substrate-binding protein